MQAILSAEKVSKSFGQVTAARDISVEIPAGQTVGIIGANGAGKTTFVNMITGYLPPSSGTIRFQGKDITGLGPRPSPGWASAALSRSPRSSRP